MCYLSVQILGTIMVTEKSGQTYFILKPHFNKTNTLQAPSKHIQTNLSTQETLKTVLKRKIKLG